MTISYIPFFLKSEIVYGSDEVGEGPADRDGPPYAELPDAGHRSEDE